MTVFVWAQAKIAIPFAVSIRFAHSAMTHCTCTPSNALSGFGIAASGIAHTDASTLHSTLEVIGSGTSRHQTKVPHFFSRVPHSPQEQAQKRSTEVLQNRYEYDTDAFGRK